MLKIEAAQRLMATSSKAITKAIKAKFGYDVELIRGRGYYYFADASDKSVVDYWSTTAVYVNSLNQLTLPQWLEEFESLMKDNHD